MREPATGRLQFHGAEETPVDVLMDEDTCAEEINEEPKPEIPDADLRPVRETAQRTCRKQKQMEKCPEKAGRESGQTGKPREKEETEFPVRHGGKVQSQNGSGAGRRKSRLQFEGQKAAGKREPPLLRQSGKGIMYSVGSAAAVRIHQKIQESEQENVGVEAAYRAEAAAEYTGGRISSMGGYRLRTRSCRTMKQAERHAALAQHSAARRKFSADSRDLQKKTLAKQVQRQKIKRKYADAARKAVKETGHTARAFTTAGEAVRRMAGYFKAGKAVLAIGVIAVLAFAMSGALFDFGASLFMGMESAVVSACYLAGEAEINRSELCYTELETDLRIAVRDTERDYPGYDEYRYSIGGIGHSPYELMGYLSAAFGEFTYEQVETELYRLFGLQYQLTREAVTETVTCLDEEGEEQEYEQHVLNTVLTVHPLSEILSDALAAEGEAERYNVYMQTFGGRQMYGSPFAFAWLEYVTSPYGYRVHPISGEKNLHRGVDIAAAEGTPILAVQDGHVVTAGDAGGYGLCLVIENADGYQSRYAHCSHIAVSAGQEVGRGDVVAYVGSTGNSTGSHLHLEIVHDGEYLNPYFFVDSGIR